MKLHDTLVVLQLYMQILRIILVLYRGRCSVIAVVVLVVVTVGGARTESGKAGGGTGSGSVGVAMRCRSGRSKEEGMRRRRVGGVGVKIGNAKKRAGKRAGGPRRAGRFHDDTHLHPCVTINVGRGESERVRARESGARRQSFRELRGQCVVGRSKCSVAYGEKDVGARGEGCEGVM